MSASLADLSLRESVARLRLGEITPAELLEACLERIDATQESCAFVAVDADGARRQAREPQPAPLHGVPVAIKDLVDVAGLPTRGGTRALDDAGAARVDATVVADLRARGAIPVGKTATHELGSGVTTPAVRNPRFPGRTAGGSSGGSAAAVAAGAVPVALGTDTAGSVRIPAACCGICGLIGRRGRLPMDGVMANSHSLDTLGMLVREPGDLPLAWHALSGAPPGDRTLSTVLVCSPHMLGRVDDSQLAAAAAAVEGLDLPVRELSLEPLRDWAPLRAIVIDDESLHAHRQVGLYPADGLGEAIAEAHAHAERRPSDEVDAARARLAGLGGELYEAVGDGCVLVLPALAMAPPPRELPDGQVIGRLSRLVAPMNIARLASAVVPIGGTGVQFAGRDEDTVLAAVARLTA
ncbi:MAG TPA: amidase [Solirubrobacteraceae bacterium]|nr:amidase [Solirubrobacteraceae bacterium]